MKNNLYDILGVDKNATAEEITKRMQELSEAFAVLGDPEKRRQYNASLTSPEVNRPFINYSRVERTEKVSQLETMVATNSINYVYGIVVAEGIDVICDYVSRAKTNHDFLDGIYWINMATEQTKTDSYRSIAAQLKITPDDRGAERAVKVWFRSNQNCLLIYFNVTDEKTLDQCERITGTKTIFSSTIKPDTAESHCMEIGTLNEEQAKLFILKFKRYDKNFTDEQVTKLIAVAGKFPGTLRTICDYFIRMNVGIDKFISLLDGFIPDMFKKVNCWKPLLEKLSNEHLILLKALAYLNPNSTLPTALVDEISKKLFPQLNVIAINNLKVDFYGYMLPLVLTDPIFQRYMQQMTLNKNECDILMAATAGLIGYNNKNNKQTSEGAFIELVQSLITHVTQLSAKSESERLSIAKRDLTTILTTYQEATEKERISPVK